MHTVGEANVSPFRVPRIVCCSQAAQAVVISVAASKSDPTDALFTNSRTSFLRRRKESSKAASLAIKAPGKSLTTQSSQYTDLLITTRTITRQIGSEIRINDIVVMERCQSTFMSLAFNRDLMEGGTVFGKSFEATLIQMTGIMSFVARRVWPSRQGRFQ